MQEARQTGKPSVRDRKAALTPVESWKRQSLPTGSQRFLLFAKALFERCSDDRASAAERIFALVNMSSGGEGWRDVKLVQHQHEVSGGVLVAPASPSGEAWEGGRTGTSGPATGEVEKLEVLEKS